MATTITAAAGPAALTSRRDTSNQWGNWSEARWDAVLPFSSAIPASAEIQSAVLTVNVTQDPICGPWVYVDGQQVRASMGAKQVNIPITPGTTSRTVPVTFKGTGTTYSTSQLVLTLALTVTYVIKTSTLALSSASVYAGGSVTATVGAYDPSYSHALTLALGSRSHQWAMAAGVTAQAVDVPMAWLDQLTATSTAAATLRLDTIKDGAVIGSVTQTLTVAAPAASGPTFQAACAPLYTVGGVTYPSPTGGYVRGKCGVTASLTAPAGQYGAAIARTEISVSGTAYSISGAGAVTLASGLLISAGAVNVVFRAVDSRGIAREQVVALDVADYAPPVMATLSGMRCDEDGAANSLGVRCWYEVAWEHSDLGGANPCAAALSIKARESDQWNAATSDAASGQSGVLTGASGQMEISQGSVYDLRLTLTDAYGAVNFTATVPSAKFVRTVNRALNAVAYGKAAEHQDSFEIDAGLEVWCYGKRLGALVDEKAGAYGRAARARNLLDNSYWGKKSEIVNQRGQQSYTGPMYGIDRWRTWSANSMMEIHDGYISHTGTLWQYIEMDEAPTEVYTVAVMRKDGKLKVWAGIPTDSEDAPDGVMVQYSAVTKLLDVFIGGQHNEIVWAALYKGEYTADTLPTYVPKGYAAELMECKRYCRTADWGTAHNMPLYGYASSATQINAFLPTDVPMLAVPSISDTSGGNWLIVGNGGRINPTSVSTWFAGESAIGLRFTCTGTAANIPYIIVPASAAVVVLSADL